MRTKGVTTGEKLREAIASRFPKLTQGQDAKKLGVPPGNLSEWLNGKHEPTLGSLREIAPKLRCTIAALIGDEAAP